MIHTFYKTTTVAQGLKISVMTLRRTVEFLREKLGAEILDKNPYERGFSQQACEILSLYFNFRKQGMSRERAARYVKQTLENQAQ